MQAVNDTLNTAFGQRQISTIYGQSNQYRVVLEAMPEYQTDPSWLSKLYVPASPANQTATTTAPNFVRGAVVPVTLLFQALREPLGLSAAGLTVGLLTVTIAAVALWGLDETFGRDLDFVED